MKSDRLNVAVIGAGNIAVRHLENLRFLGGNRVVAICDIDEALLGSRCHRYGARGYRDWKALFAEEGSLDVVFICTPPGLRKPIIEVCVDRGIAFLCEKPPAQTLKEAREIARLLSDRKLVHSVGFNQRYAPSVDRCKELTRGRPVTLIDAVVVSDAAATRKLADWFYLKEYSAGLFDSTVHTLDVIRYIAGEVEAVHAFGSNMTIPLSERFTCEDSMSINLRFASGAIGTVLLSWACAQGRNSLTLSGADFELSLKAIPPRIEGALGRPGERAQQVSEIIPQGPAMGRSGRIHPDRRPEDPPDPPHFQETKVLLDAIRSQSMVEIRSDYLDAARTSALLHAIESSISSGGVEQVPFIE